MTSILEQLGIAADITEQLEAAKAAEMELEDSGYRLPEFVIKPGETNTISVAPGLGDWVKFARSQMDNPDSPAGLQWITERATAQLRALDINDVIPSWAKFPANFPAAVGVSGLFVPRLGRVSYARFPAPVLEKLPADHPRKVALTIKGKFGLPKVKHAILLYCIEHPVGKRGLDDAALNSRSDMADSSSCCS